MPGATLGNMNSTRIALASAALATLLAAGAVVPASAVAPDPAVGSSCSAKGGALNGGEVECWTTPSDQILNVKAAGDGAKYHVNRADGSQKTDTIEIKANNVGHIELDNGDTIYLERPVFAWNTHQLTVVP